jgi:hypothetical protein
VIRLLDARGQIGQQWPFQCAKHPEDVVHIDDPAELQRRFPQGEIRVSSLLALTYQFGQVDV